MLKKFSRSREGEKEWRVTGWILVIGVVVGFFGGLIVYKADWGTGGRGRGFGFTTVPFPDNPGNIIFLTWV